MSSNWNYECVANSNVNRLGHVKSMHKMFGGGHNGAKAANFDHFGGVVAITTEDTPNLELRVSGKLKCESFELCEKCAQNNWGSITAQKQQILIILGVKLP